MAWARGTASERTIIVPYGGYETKVARRLKFFAAAWLPAALLVWAALRLGPPAVALLVSFGPLIYLELSPSLLRRLPGGHWLVASQPYAVELDHEGMTFPHPDEPVRRVRWEDIERMDTDRWGAGRLIGRNGEGIVEISPAYVRLHRGGLGFRSRSLAIEIVSARPDLFVLSPPANRFTQPYGFQRPSAGYEPPNLAAIDGRQVLIYIALFATLGAALIIVFLLFPGGTPRG